MGKSVRGAANSFPFLQFLALGVTKLKLCSRIQWLWPPLPSITNFTSYENLITIENMSPLNFRGLLYFLPLSSSFLYDGFPFSPDRSGWM
jgi:hypothetical protein